MNQLLLRYVESLPFFDMHSHVAGFDLGTPTDDREGLTLPKLLVNDYLAYLSGSCVDQAVAPQKNADGQGEDVEKSFRSILPLLERCRGLTTYAALREGIRRLHPFVGKDITLKNWRQINRRIGSVYRRYGHRAWQREVMKRAGVVRQVQIVHFPYVVDHWGSLPPAERQAQQQVLMPSLVLDGLLFTGFVANNASRERSMELVHLRPRGHAEHLEFCGRVLDRFLKEGGKSVKLLAAYLRPLRFEEVADPEAERLYEKGPDKLQPQELRRLQDNLLWRLLEMAVARKLPLIVHTGYSIPLEWGDPELLLNLFGSRRLSGLKVALAHSGWPNEAAAMIMARTYRGAYIDLCWTPLLSEELGRRVLSEAIDTVPMNKILIGTDCGTVEMFMGTAVLIRRVLAEVLGDKVRRGQFPVETAKTVARAILWENPCEFHGMDPALPGR